MITSRPTNGFQVAGAVRGYGGDVQVGEPERVDRIVDVLSPACTGLCETEQVPMWSVMPESQGIRGG
jgi:hypothetical protein